jgi:2-succinyl-5-enolpyruvyl-6-hydroxy-3-cyclohexene-1-carboxylate synthase
MASTSQEAAEHVQATFCATLVDEWIRCGLRHVVIAPGSRSTPMALALAARNELSVQVAHDERCAAFIALGIGLHDGAPAALLCTSGTAATHFHAAVVEAGLSHVPMLVLTADRPPELHGVGAPQTIDQTRLYGSAAEFFDPGVASADGQRWWRRLARDTWHCARPAHLNLMFREPLVGVAGPLPPTDNVDVTTTLDGGVDAWVETVAASLPEVRGVVVAGRGVDDPAAVESLAAALGWPILADPRSGCRGLVNSVCAADALLRHEAFAAAHRPAVVLHLGEPPASKVVNQWLQASGAVHHQVLPGGGVIDPSRIMSTSLHKPVGLAVRALSERIDAATTTPWQARWRHAERAAQDVFDALCLGESVALTEPAVARVVSQTEGPLVVSSSMPIRDIEWFGHPTQRATVRSNRGANGIDGVIATAIGVGLASSQPVTVLLGDVAFLHDSSSLVALARRPVTVRIVVVDNDGGGIFSFLPQAAALEPERFETLFGTPHGADVLALGAAHGIAGIDAGTADELRAALTSEQTVVIRVRSDRVANVSHHAELNAAVCAALDVQQ